MTDIKPTTPPLDGEDTVLSNEGYYLIQAIKELTQAINRQTNVKNG